MEMLSGVPLARLRNAPLTYDEVGATRGSLPPGYHHVHRSAVIGRGTGAFERAAEVLMTWGVLRRAGLEVRPSSESVVADAVAVQRLGVGPFRLDAPVRVVYVVDQPRRRGFAYGTLPGHPERGEEAFVLELHDDERVTFTVTAFARPASLLTRLGGPVGRAVQSRMVERYLRALQA